jgi:hypothetical protein
MNTHTENLDNFYRDWYFIQDFADKIVLHKNEKIDLGLLMGVDDLLHLHNSKSNDWLLKDYQKMFLKNYKEMIEYAKFVDNKNFFKKN